jgi:alanine racemase
MRPTWLEIDLGALARNFQRIRDRVAPRRLWCVVKANAYGHGAVEVARRLQEEGGEAFAVATVDEGVQLRAAGITGDILVMAGIEPLHLGDELPVVDAVGGGVLPSVPDRESFGRGAARAAVEHSLTIAVWGDEAAAALGAAALEAGERSARVQLKVDTGMGRLGVLVDESPDAASEMAERVAATDGVELEGVFSNLGAADVAPDQPRHENTRLQIERFKGVCAALDAVGLLPEHRHLSNSADILHHDRAWAGGWCTGVRPGLSLFGVLPFSGRATGPLEPVMAWHSAVAAVRRVPSGWPLGYGAMRRAETDSTIAVVPVGYHDGFPRTLNDKAEMLVAGRRAKVVGAISMDLTLVDITGNPDARVGSPVVLLGSGAGPGAEAIRAEELAERAGTVPWEILCRIGTRVPLRFVDRSP